MDVIFRADASIEIGTGHVMRCLTLAEALRQRGANCRFVCRQLLGNMIDAIRQRGFEVSGLSDVIEKESMGSDSEEALPVHSHWLGVDWRIDATQTLNAIGKTIPDWLIVDHYALDARWEQMLRPASKRIMLIDDLADRFHDCDILLDQNLGRRSTDYEKFVPQTCHVLTGPEFALLRPEFSQLREESLKRRHTTPAINQLLISLGGIDKDNVTGLILESLKISTLPKECHITIILGSGCPWIESIRELAADLPWSTEVLVNTSEMASLMRSCDLAIGAAGSTAWERCCLGLPTLIVALAENQKANVLALSSVGAALNLGTLAEIPSKLHEALQQLTLGEHLQQMVAFASGICDGSGATRVTAILAFQSAQHIIMRNAEARDSHLLYRWANDVTTRLNSINSEPIPWETHQKWYVRKLTDITNSLILIGQLNEEIPCGQVRFDRDNKGVWSISYGLAAEFRGLGLGKPLLAAGLDVFRDRFPHVPVIGKIKATNKPSIRIFESLGFHLISQDNTGVLIYGYP